MDAYFGYRQSCNTPGRAADEINYHTWCSIGPTISNNKLTFRKEMSQRK